MLGCGCRGWGEGEVGAELQSTVAAMVVPVVGFIGGMRYQKEQKQSYCDVDDDRQFAHLICRRRWRWWWWCEREISMEWRSQSLSLVFGVCPVMRDIIE